MCLYTVSLELDEPSALDRRLDLSRDELTRGCVEW